MLHNDVTDIVTDEELVKGLQIERELKRGAFGIVYKCQITTPELHRKLVKMGICDEKSFDLVMKMPQSGANIEDFKKEGLIADKLRKIALARNEKQHCYNLATPAMLNGNPVILSRFANGGDIHNYCGKKQVTNIEAATYFVSLMKALKILSDNNILHHDIAGRNLLIENGQLVITDYGLSEEMVNGQFVTTSDVGPIRWMDKGRLLYRTSTPASDIYSAKVAMIEILANMCGIMGTSILDGLGSISEVAAAMAKEGEDAVLGKISAKLPQGNELYQAFKPFLTPSTHTGTTAAMVSIDPAKQREADYEVFLKCCQVYAAKNEAFKAVLENSNIHSVLTTSQKIENPDVVIKNMKPASPKPGGPYATPIFMGQNEPERMENITPAASTSGLNQLKDYLKNHDEKEKPAILGKQFITLIQTIENMHKGGDLNLDILGDNIRIDHEGNISLKPSQFKTPIAKAAEANGAPDQGPIRYLDRIRITQRRATTASDFYALKITMLEMIAAACGMPNLSVLQYIDSKYDPKLDVKFHVYYGVEEKGERFIFNQFKQNLEAYLDAHPHPELRQFYEDFKVFLDTNDDVSANPDLQTKQDLENFRVACQRFALHNQSFDSVVKSVFKPDAETKPTMPQTDRIISSPLNHDTIPERQTETTATPKQGVPVTPEPVTPPSAQSAFQDLFDKARTGALETKPDKLPDFNFNKSSIQTDLAAAHNYIKALQKDGFYVYQDKGNEQLVKYNPDAPLDPLNPIHPHEAEIQAMRFLRGMLIIAENSHDKDREKLLHEIKLAYNVYLYRLEKNPAEVADHTHQLAEAFASILLANQGLSDIKKARKQVFMAHDIAILVENHPPVITVSQSDKKVTIEKASHLPISPAYYDKHFSQVRKQPWFKDACGYGGIDSSKDNWLSQFFSKNLDELKKRGLPAPSSARWLPLPGNSQLIETHVANIDANDHLATGLTTSFVRMGTVTPLFIKDKKTRKALATEQLKEIIKAEIDARIKAFKEIYGAYGEKDFYINYQSLLSPWKLEEYGPHKDNNAKFVQMGKEAMEAISKEMKQVDGINLHFYQTNAAINKRTVIGENEIENPLIQSDKKDMVIRRKKLVAAQKTLKNLLVLRDELDLFREDSLIKNRLLPDLNKGKFSRIKNPLSAELQLEVAIRLQAGLYLTKLLDGEEPYKSLPPYKRNLMMTTLETLLMGSQSLTLAGCKSARDRTAIYAAALKTMQENPKAMYDWETLNEGIIKSLIQGHHFRAALWHAATAKVSAVSNYYMEQLPDATQEAIENYKRFTKSLGSPEEYAAKLEKKLLKKAKAEKPDVVDLSDIMVSGELERESTLTEEQDSQKKSPYDPIPQPQDVIRPTPNESDSVVFNPMPHQDTVATSEHRHEEVVTEHEQPATSNHYEKLPDVEKPKEVDLKQQSAVLTEFYASEKKFRNDMETFVNFFGDLNNPENHQYLNRGELPENELAFLKTFLIPYQLAATNPYGERPQDNNEAIQTIVAVIFKDLDILFKSVISNPIEYKKFVALVDYVDTQGGFKEIQHLGISSFAIKLQQRIMKYPLLLKEITDTVPESHPFYALLVDARDKVIQAVKYINEHERNNAEKDIIVNTTYLNDLTTAIKKQINNISDYGKKNSNPQRKQIVQKILSSLEVKPTLADKLTYLHTILDPRSPEAKIIDHHLNVKNYFRKTSLRIKLENLAELLSEANRQAKTYEELTTAQAPHFDHEPSNAEVRDSLSKMHDNMSPEFKVGQKKAAKDPSSGVYEFPYSYEDKDKQHYKIQPVTYQPAKTDPQKNIAAVITSNIMNALINIKNSSASAFFAVPTASTGEEATPTGDNLYVGTVAIDNATDLFRVLNHPARSELTEAFCKTDINGKVTYDANHRKEPVFANFAPIAVASLLTGSFNVSPGNFSIATAETTQKSDIEKRLSELNNVPAVDGEVLRLFLKGTDLPQIITDIANNELGKMSLAALEGLAAFLKIKLDYTAVVAKATEEGLSNIEIEKAKKKEAAEQIKYYFIRKGIIEGKLVKNSHTDALRDLGTELHLHAVAKHPLAASPTDHLRQFPRDFKINPAFAKELERQANVDEELTAAIIKSMAELEHFCTAEFIMDFARELSPDFKIDQLLSDSLKEIGLPVHSSHGKINFERYNEKDSVIVKAALVELTQNFLLARMKVRQEEAKRLAMEIKLSLCLQKQPDGDFKPVTITHEGESYDIASLIEQDPVYFLKGDFHFRGSDQRTVIFGPINTKFLLEEKLTNIVNQELVKPEHLGAISKAAVNKLSAPADMSVLNLVFDNAVLMQNRDQVMNALAAQIQNSDTSSMLEKAIFSDDKQHDKYRCDYIELWLRSSPKNSLGLIDRILADRAVIKNHKEAFNTILNSLTGNKDLYEDFVSKTNNALETGINSSLHPQYVELWVKSTLAMAQNKPDADSIQKLIGFFTSKAMHPYMSQYSKQISQLNNYLRQENTNSILVKVIDQIIELINMLNDIERQLTNSAKPKQPVEEQTMKPKHNLTLFGHAASTTTHEGTQNIKGLTPTKKNNE